MIMKGIPLLLAVTLLFVTSFSAFSQPLSRNRGEVLVMVSKDAEIRKISSRMNQELGLLANVRPARLLSDQMRTWLIAFDEDHVEMKEMLYALGKDPEVMLCQTNKFVAERIIPNDPFFSEQWHHQQNGDHDIDTPEAWDITTGGTTATGDEIVVCVIEGNGAKWDQADIVGNHWVNVHEIPDNGIDDDGNGYTDDYDGWNITTDTDNIGTGNHGTQVSSMIGSKGNNNTGVTGVNWDVKLMQVSMGGISESNVVEAYNYPWKLRRMYNDSNGETGAFVVSTNSSWGIDGGNPNSSPIWCAMYDSLGTYGIISCGATANNNVNIDVIGDLPTACPSGFLISVTATNSNDIRTFSGYGATHIDLGAPGEDVYLAGNNSYGSTSGTSFATPCVAGAIALLYSAPCVTFMAQVHNDPGAAAIIMRDLIFNGVDAVSNLEDETVTGGRLNVKNSLDLLLENCFDAPCTSPFNLAVTQEPGTLNYSVSWLALSDMAAFNFRYRPVGAPDWIEINELDESTVQLNDLLSCSSYEIQAQTICESETSDWSASFILDTDGCCIDPGGVAVSITGPGTATVSWNPVMAATGYTLVLTPSSGEEIIYTDIEGTGYTLSDLLPCEDYIVQVFSVCTGGELPPAPGHPFSTPGCGSCSDFEYCSSEGDSDLEWIQSVEINTLNNNSGNNNGYTFFEDMSTELELDETYEITLTPGYSGQSYSEYFKVWIDYDANGTFDPDEEVYDAGDGTNEAITGDITIPVNAFPGSTRMRVSMSYYGFFGGSIPYPCTDPSYGEVEDYCVTIVVPESVREAGEFTFGFYPNPAQDMIRWNMNDPLDIRVYNTSGQLVLETLKRTRSLDISQLAGGLYEVRATKTDGKVLSGKLILQR